MILVLATDAAVIVDWSRLEALRTRDARGEPDLVPLVIETFVVDARERMARARAAALGGDLTAVTHEAHAMRGSAGLIGAEPLRRDAERLERAARSGDAAAIDHLLERTEASLAATLLALAACPFRD